MDSDKLLSCVGLIILGIGVAIISVILNAWALQTLWGWFVASTFDLTKLTIVQAMGISCIVTFFISHSTSSTAREKDVDWYKAIAFAIFQPIFYVGFGWIIKQFL